MSTAPCDFWDAICEKDFTPCFEIIEKVIFVRDIRLKLTVWPLWIADRTKVGGLNSYRNCVADPRWTASPILAKLAQSGGRFNLVCAALFDLVCTAEYLHERVTNRNWIYCHRERDKPDGAISAYYSFLKQCPKCCQDLGLEARLSGAQHKPSSHHIGEITTTVAAFFLGILAQCAPKPLSVGVISKQSHDVDAVAWRDDLLVLFEIKASPLVNYPLRVRLAGPFKEDTDSGPQEVSQHKLIDVEYQMHKLCLYLANTDRDIQPVA
jgi:hypothetical protein